MKKYCLLFSRLLPIVLLAAACKKEQTVINPARPTILQYIAQDSELTLLNAAITRCGLDTVFTSGGPFTLFCPVDSAFIAGGMTLAKINNTDPDTLSRFLQYHMITGKVSVNDIVGFLSENVSTLDSGVNAYLTKNYYGVFINGIPVTSTIEAGDGVVQKIALLDPPPMKTVLQLIDSLPELSYFAAVVAQIPQFQDIFDSLPTPAWVPYDGPVYQGYYRGVPGFTVMAPTNAAFLSSPWPTLSAIQQADPNDLMNVFNTYVLNGYLFTSNFLGGYIQGTQYNNLAEFLPNGFNFQMEADGLTVVAGSAGSQQPPRIIKPNVLGSNGVIQEIDEVYITQ